MSVGLLFYRHYIDGNAILLPVPNFTDEQQQQNIEMYLSPYGASTLIYMDRSGKLCSHSTMEYISVQGIDLEPHGIGGGDHVKNIE